MSEKTSTHIQQTDLQLDSSEPSIDIYATKRWYNENGQLHREDGPAVERANGNNEWWLNGNLHRENGPAIELASGTKFWILNGKVHRKDGPAREWANGTKQWYKNGKLHREDGPAIEWADGHIEWYLNGEVCREEVAIVEWSDDTKEWTLPDLIELGYTEIELESLPEVFEDTQTLSFQDGGAVHDQDGWLHLEGLFHRHELESLLAVIAPCIKIPILLILKEPNTQEEQTLIFDKSGVYDRSGHEVSFR
jgi:hypothetical protein